MKNNPKLYPEAVLPGKNIYYKKSYSVRVHSLSLINCRLETKPSCVCVSVYMFIP